MLLYIEDPKDATRKLLKLISKFGNFVGYKINTNWLHFYTLKMQGHKEKFKKQSYLPLY